MAAHAADRELVRRVIQRDPEAVRQFIMRMHCVVRFVSLRNAQLGRPLVPQAVEDVVQEVLATVWRKLVDYRGDAQFETWVYPFCEFELRNAIRRAARRRTVPLDDVADPGAPDEGGAPIAADELEPVFAALRRLAAAEATVIRLKHFEGLTFEQISARLSVSPNTAKTRYYRALDKVRRHLRAQEAEES